MPANTRHRVMSLYKELHRLGRDYPDPAYNFNGRMRRLFEKNKNLTNPEDIERAIKLGEYIKNETLALYSLRKYRALKRMYPEDNDMRVKAALDKVDTTPNEAPSASSSKTQDQQQGG